MKCDLCDQCEATIVYTHIVGNDKKTLHLCSACIAQQGPQSAPPSGQSAAIHVVCPTAAAEPSSARCSCCGMRYEEFRKTGRLGCSECYAAFAAPLAPLLKRIHDAERHVGKGRIGAQTPLPEEDLTQLHRELERAVKEEAYERAAELRDRIAQTEEKMEMGGGAP